MFNELLPKTLNNNELKQKKILKTKNTKTCNAGS